MTDASSPRAKSRARLARLAALFGPALLVGCYVVPIQPEPERGWRPHHHRHHDHHRKSPRPYYRGPYGLDARPGDLAVALTPLGQSTAGNVGIASSTAAPAAGDGLTGAAAGDAGTGAVVAVAGPLGR